MEEKYRIIEGIGPYFNKRWELQEKYSYYENGEKSYHGIQFSIVKIKRIVKKYYKNIKQYHKKIIECLFLD